MTLSVYNTLTRRKEAFKPLHPDWVGMFVCGPTVYDYSHLGHAKTYTHFDLVARYLRHCGYTVRYVQNITDVDDKIIARARECGVAPLELAREFEQAYRDDMAALGNTSVDTYARAHDFIPQIVDQVRRLIDGGHAYRLDDGWYFDLSSFPGYGKLSGRTQRQAEDAVSRVDDNPGKRNAGDFALWKASKPGDPSWDTELGPGRPGWHIEDTAITETLLGPRYDLHGGAIDLIFPHHEAEIAQMESASGLEPLAGYWIHGGLLRVGDVKMSKSLGNFQTIREALKATDPAVLRFAFLSQHHRSSMDLTEWTLTQARSALKRVENFATGADPHVEEDTGRVEATRDEFFDRMDDDFDTPAALAALFGFIRATNREGRPAGRAALELLEEVNSVFRVFDLASRADLDVEVEVRELIERRRDARVRRDFAAADAIREQLAAIGVVLEDRSDGTTTWRKEPTPI